MGYFPNGLSGIEYESRYCDRCVHQKLDDGGCAVWALHLVHNYERIEPINDALNALIPMSEDGLSNLECTMFHEDGEADPELSEADRKYMEWKAAQ